MEPVEGHIDDDNEELIFVGKKLKAHMKRLRKLKEGASENDSSIDGDYHAEDDLNDDDSYDVDMETNVGVGESKKKVDKLVKKKTLMKQEMSV